MKFASDLDFCLCSGREFEADKPWLVHGPKRLKTSPSGTLRLKWSTAVKESNLLVNPSVSKLDTVVIFQTFSVLLWALARLHV